MEFNFFRKYRHKQFNYTPLYYNQQKEELQERIKRIEREERGGGDGDFSPGIIKGSFQHLRSLRAKSQRRSSVTVIIIAALLLAIVYYIFSS